MVLCLVQFMDGVPQGHAVAKNLRELRRKMPDSYPYRDINAVLARITQEPGAGRYGLGDGYWLLVTERRSWLQRLLGR
ncbi:hypothetical protein [Ramlibacter alkalitolerans]|uniref:Uncharacterized protein n=1 Tax=Ramlibacter alkalitolerans TaxID=2039631 RepID=A0ABS1JRR8_9BURK|nr:hypothetical protein [Ramlibacter alkalitolerans]MBL0426541.1 hypothetical protein [Ramlibacter alkalitolerans]